MFPFGTLNRSKEILLMGCDEPNLIKLNFLINCLIEMPIGEYLGVLINKLEKRTDLDNWINRRIKQGIMIVQDPFHEAEASTKAEEWAYKFGYFERRLIKREKNRKFLNYIFLLGNWVITEPDLPKKYLRSIFRIILLLYRKESISIRKEIIRLIGKILRRPPRNLDRRILNLLNSKLISLLRDESWEIRIFSAASLLHTENQLVVNFLEEQLISKAEAIPEEVLFEIFELAKNVKSPRITSVLIHLYNEKVASTSLTEKLRSGIVKIRFLLSKYNLWVCQSLANHQSDIAFDALIYYLEHDQTEEFEKSRIITALIEIKDKLSYVQIQKLIQSRSPWSRTTGALLIGERRQTSEIPLLSELFDDEFIITREYAIRAANKIKFHGIKTWIGNIKSGRIQDFLKNNEENLLLQRALLESELISLNKTDIKDFVKSVIQMGDPNLIESLLNYLKFYPCDDVLDHFNSLLDVNYDYFSKRYTQLYLEKRTSPKLSVLNKMMDHSDWEIRIRTAVYILAKEAWGSQLRIG
jgi:hypothetical protein